MTLHQALKQKKKLTGRIAALKSLIESKNSYPEGTVDPENFDVRKLNEELLEKIRELVTLKLTINEMNRVVQEKIYNLSEYKALIAFWNSVPVHEGEHVTGDFGSRIVRTYVSQIDEKTRDEMVREFQDKVDLLQEELDGFNYTTSVSLKG